MTGHDQPYDLIVVGLGAMGSAALAHAAKFGALGKRVLGIDRHQPPHTLGSSHAESRITRLAVGEGSQYLPFVARSHELWRELEAATGEALLHLSGGYIICQPQPTDPDRWGNFVTLTESVADGAEIDFARRSVAEFGQHLPHVSLNGDEVIGFESTGGIVMCERAVELQIAQACAAGAAVSLDTNVSKIVADDDGVSVTAGGEVHRAQQVIVATGPWFEELASPVDKPQVQVTRQVVFWFEVEDPAAYHAASFPFLIWAGDRAEDYLGVFPMTDGGAPGLKVLGEQFLETTDADLVDRSVSPEEIAEFHARFIAPRLAGVTDRCLKAEVCLYTNTPDDHFLIDTHPDSERVLYASPCSGHGFKHSAALGEAMAQKMLTGVSTLDLSAFGRQRWS